jgi:hypothetical protein
VQRLGSSRYLSQQCQHFGGVRRIASGTLRSDERSGFLHSLGFGVHCNILVDGAVSLAHNAAMTQAPRACQYGELQHARSAGGECGPEARQLFIASWIKTEPAPVPSRWVYDRRKQRNAP